MLCLFFFSYCLPNQGVFIHFQMSEKSKEGDFAHLNNAWILKGVALLFFFKEFEFLFIFFIVVNFVIH